MDEEKKEKDPAFQLFSADFHRFIYGNEHVVP